MAGELLEVARETRERCQLIAKPNIPLRVAVAILVLLGLAASPAGGWDTLVHLALTVLPVSVANSVALCLIVLVVVLVAGVGTGWLVAAYDFPGRNALAWALVLPLAMPAFTPLIALMVR